MADSMSFDFSDLTKLAADLGQVAANAGPFLRSAVEVTSRNVKDAADASVKAAQPSWKKPLKSAIDYELTAAAGNEGSTLQSEIGYNTSRYGDRAKLGNLREFGAPAKRLAPHNDLLNALHENEKDFQHGLEEALKDAERKTGL